MIVQRARLFTTLALLPTTLCLAATCARSQEELEPLGFSQALVQTRKQPTSTWDEALPEAAQKMIAQLLENPYEEISQNRARQFINRLQMMQDTYTRSNRIE